MFRVLVKKTYLSRVKVRLTFEFDYKKYAQKRSVSRSTQLYYIKTHTRDITNEKNHGGGGVGRRDDERERDATERGRR